MSVGAGAYAATEAANASPLQTLEQDVLAVINAPTETFLGRPLIGDGTNAAVGSGKNGGDGGDGNPAGHGGTGGHRGLLFGTPGTTGS